MLKHMYFNRAEFIATKIVSKLTYVFTIGNYLNQIALKANVLFIASLFILIYAL